MTQASTEGKMDLSQVPFEPYYRDEHCVIYNADCRKVLPFLPKFDLGLHDPPYGIGEARKDNTSRSCLAKSKDYGKHDWDDSPPDSWLLSQMMQAAETTIFWGGNYFELPPSSCWLVWDKDNGKNDFADCELAWTNIPKAVRRFKFRWQGMLQERMGDKKEVRIHPTQKPMALFRWCFEHVVKCDTVLDCFGGSLTTAAACKLENRFCVVIEASEAYCEKGVKRLEQGVLF